MFMDALDFTCSPAQKCMCACLADCTAVSSRMLTQRTGANGGDQATKRCNLQRTPQYATIRAVSEMSKGSRDAKDDRMQESPDLFKAYHDGFRIQAQTWAVNPVDLAIKWLQRKPSGLTVADFGCGDAKIAESLHKEHHVHSFDLYAHNKWVTACNMAHVPCKNGKSPDCALVYCASAF